MLIVFSTHKHEFMSLIRFTHLRLAPRYPRCKEFASSGSWGVDTGQSNLTKFRDIGDPYRRCLYPVVI